MSRRSTPSSDEFRDDLDYDRLTFDNELGRELARVRRRREGGQQRGLSKRLEGHTTPLSAGVGRSPYQSPLVTANGVRDALQRAMEMSGVSTAPPGRGGRRDQCVVSEFGRAQRDGHPGRSLGLAVAYL